jgi:hypothetical protein
MYRNSDRLIVFDVDGTIIDAYSAIVETFSRHGMELGDLERFQKRHNLFKYLGGIKGGCKKFCVNGLLAGNCRLAWSNDDRRTETLTQRPY